MSRLLAYCACGLLGAVGCRFPYPDQIEPDATDDAGTSSDAPDGVDVIAFVSMRDGDAEIYTMAIDGSGISNLTRNSAVDTQPLWVTGWRPNRVLVEPGWGPGALRHGG
ncbi:MAG: hypothetical protein KJZ91_06930 [Myxococcales bacterium]|nr:hypothetical protein [Myxococcales bacterium]